MASRKVPITFTFHKAGVQPPLFVAGSFSRPPWQPFEMDVSRDQHGEYMFIKQLLIDEGADYQYKFRLGSGDWWAVDPDADTVNDDQGNVNNLLRVPVTSTPVPARVDTEDHFQPSSDALVAETSENPVEPQEDKGKKPMRSNDALPNESAETPAAAAETIDTVTPLGDIVQSDDGSGLPMFTHECFSPQCDMPAHEPLDDDSDFEEGLDQNDPRLEHFPAEREAIFATIRRLSTTMELPSPAFTPVFTSSNLSNTSSPSENRGSLAAEENERLQGLLHQREVVAPSETSLHSIAEDDEAPKSHRIRNQAEDSNGLTRNSTLSSSKQDGALRFGGSDDLDEGIAMGDATPTTTESKDGSTIRPDEHELGTAAKPCLVDGHTNEDAGSDMSSSSWSTDLGSARPEANRPVVPAVTSSHDGESPKERNWFQALVHMVIVDWIGGLFYWLCGRERHRGFPIGALIALGAGLLIWALKDSLPWLRSTDRFTDSTIRL
ncbi:hypothetical protein F5Y16DRAFT_388269 [Xylariaceae sp. FL0255]|nr:hypothetical protein F5Y16DRAFT_388269 [Xylariaceae sp. FL0255]